MDVLGQGREGGIEGVREGEGGVVGSIGSRFNMRIEGVGFYH